MNYKELQDAAILGRFKEADRPTIATWLNTRAQRIWNSIRWSFAASDIIAITLASGNNTVAFPALLRTVEHVYDDLGDELEKIPYAELKSRYRADLIAGRLDRPRHFSVRNRSIILGPAPNSGYTWACDGQLVWGHDDGAGNFVAGDMSADTDLPYWPANHHELLVPAARSSVMQLRSDPSFPPLETTVNDLYAAMVDELAEDHGISSYGGLDPL